MLSLKFVHRRFILFQCDEFCERERESARTNAKWSKRTINPPRFLFYTPARTESFNEEKKEGM